MGSRGRQSAADAEIPQHVLDAEYLKPSPDLTLEQRKIWIDTVRSKPAEWFDEASRPLLEAYCQAVVSYRKVKKRIERTNTDELETIDLRRLMQMEATHAKLLINLQTRMRLTQQSKYDYKKAFRLDKKHDEDKPWND